METVDWGTHCRDCGEAFPATSGPHPTWVPCGQEETCVCGEAIYFEEGMGWQHVSLTSCDDPRPGGVRD